MHALDGLRFRWPAHAPMPAAIFAAAHALQSVDNALRHYRSAITIHYTMLQAVAADIDYDYFMSQPWALTTTSHTRRAGQIGRRHYIHIDGYIYLPHII